MFGVSSSLVCVLALAGKVAEHPLGGRSRPSRNPSCLGRQRSVWTKWARRGAQRSRAAVRVALLPYFSFFRGEGDLGVAGRPGIRIAERGTMHIWSMKIFALEVFWLCKLTWVGTPMWSFSRLTLLMVSMPFSTVGEHAALPHHATQGVSEEDKPLNQHFFFFFFIIIVSSLQRQRCHHHPNATPPPTESNK